MNNAINFYEERSVVFIESESFSDPSSLPDYDFRNLVVIARRGNGRQSWFDFGSICYQSKTVANNKSHACKVVASTLVESLLPIFDKYTRKKLSQCSANSTHSYHSKLKKFFELYTEKMQDLDFDDYEQCYQYYEKYTQELLIKKSQLKASIDKKGMASLVDTQLTFAELICLHHNKPLDEFKSSSIRIKAGKPQSNIKVVDIDDLSYFYEVNKRIFYAIKNFIMERKEFPFIFDDDFVGMPFYFYPKSGFETSAVQYFFNKDGLLFNEVEFENNISKIDQSFGKMSPEGYQNYLRSLYKRISSTDNNGVYFKSLGRAKLINYAVSAFSICLYCESSINPAQLYTLQIDDFSEYQDSVKGYKLFARKPRAKYKELSFIIDVKMLPLLKAYKEFRHWCLQLTNDKKNQDALFSFNCQKGYKKKPFDKFLPYTGATALNYQRFLSAYLPNVQWYKPTVIRKTTGNFVFEDTKSIAAASQKLGNTPKVFSRHYSDATDHTVKVQITNFFNSIHSSIINKYRENEDTIDVCINTDRKKTAIGGCKDEAAPKLKTGFNDDLEKPNCSNPSSCLFCEKYVVHSDEEDIRKLMSLKKILSMSDKTEEVLIVGNRINEILKILLDKYPHTIDIFINVAESVNDGKFDEYWRDHLNLLLELGVSFYD